MYTEKEAREKWCPEVRYKSTKGEGINRWVDADDAQVRPDMAKCIASECMMWREHKSTIESYDKDVEGWVQTGISIEGYCGLAGKP